MAHAHTPDLAESADRLREENRQLRAALAATDRGRAALQQEEEFSRLLSVSKLIVSELDAAKVFDLVADHARELVNADLVLVPMLNEDRARYTYVAASGDDAGEVRGATFGATVGMCGWVLRNERSLLYGEASIHWMDDKTRWEAGQTSAVLVPLIGRAGIIGGLSALGKRGGGPFTRHDLDILTMFANQVSIAIENALLFQQRLSAHRALSASESRFRSMIEHASVGILAADAETSRFRYANSVACRMLGYDRDELLALEVRAIHPDTELQGIERRSSAREGVQTRCIRRDGTQFAVEIKTVEMELDGAPSIVAFYTDLTERHLLEAERLKSQKLEAVGKLAGGIAHDFNNLLQGIFGYVHMARMNLDRGEDASAVLDQVENALQRTVGLTNQLLTFSKGGKPVRKPIDLRPLIEQSTRLMLSGSRSELRLSIPDGLWGAEADEGQISQVIQNIVLNADEAMPGGGSIVVTARNLADGEAPLPAGLAPGDHVEIVIQDSGVGIPQDHIGRIFDPYFTTKDKGSGLGLATSYSIVKNHGGAIDVRSAPGLGSTFVVYLPATAAGHPGPAALAGGAALPRKARVLFMDDEEALRTLGRALVRSLGHQVEIAARGEEAVALYRAAMNAGAPFDVVILDLTIRGGMGGRETLQKLLEIDPAVRAVVSSGYSDDASMAEHLAHGFEACLRKPYSVSALREVLNSLTG